MTYIPVSMLYSICPWCNDIHNFDSIV